MIIKQLQSFIKNKASSEGSFLNPTVFSTIFVGFAAGLPFLMNLSLLDIWLKQSGVSLSIIGAFAICNWPFTFKFLLSPFVDKLNFPYFSRKFGQKKGWILASQIIIFFGLCGLAFSRPDKNLIPVAVMSLLISFAYGCQGVALYSYQIDKMGAKSVGPRASMVTFGFRIGMLTASSGGLYLSYYFGWRFTYIALAFAVLISTVPIALMPEPIGRACKERRVFELISYKFKHKFADSKMLKLRGLVLECFICPMASFKRHPDWLWFLFIIATFRIGDAMAHKMAKPMYLDVGFSPIEIANIVTTYGMFTTTAGGFIGGILTRKLGLFPVMFFVGSLHAIMTVMYIVVYFVGYNVSMLYFAISAENLTGGMVSVGFMSMLYSLCRRGYPATQFALLWAIYDVCGIISRALSGVMVDHLGWVNFYLVVFFISMPSLWAVRNLSKRNVSLFTQDYVKSKDNKN